ncbi:MAG: hypothetical protein R2865_01620 [Deinococcales bacterium]
MPEFDLIIRNAKVIDGTGNPWFWGDVAIQGEKIAAVTPRGLIAEGLAKTSLDAKGLVLCPGFIDIQSHAIAPLMIDGRCLSKITQGVTTEIMGEGWTPAPFGGRIDSPIGFKAYESSLAGEWIEEARTWRRFGDWLNSMVRKGVSPNVGSFLGGGTLRSYAMSLDMRAPNSDEMKLMQRLMAESMEDGAFGISYALIYPPDAYSATDELIEICKVVSCYQGLYITHIRSEAEDIIPAMQEALWIGQKLICL